jgi:hypothetical protein
MTGKFKSTVVIISNVALGKEIGKNEGEGEL